VAVAQAGDEQVRSIFTRAGESLGIVVANLINIFDPSLVLFSGESLEASELILAPMRAAIREGVFGGLRADLVVNPEPTEDVTWARGAASVMLDEIFRPPLYETDQPLPIDELLTARTLARQAKKA
jgi:predicted NBD/HSP70 family sugar kinase